MRRRHRLPIAQRLGILFLGLLLLACAGGLGFLFLLRGYVALTPEGPALHAPLLAPEGDLAAFSEDAVTVETAAAGPEPLRALLLPVSAVETAAADALLRQRGGNAVILDMKAADGRLGYVSAQAAAIAARASAADPTRNEALRAFNGAEGRYSIARVACFRDGTLPQHDPARGLTRLSGSLWRDEEGETWLSPADEQAQDYLLALCRELAALGFDELLLTDCHFPVGGRQELLAEETLREVPRTEALAVFYTRLRELGAETGCTISLTWAGDASRSGQTPETAALAADRLWVSEAGMDAHPALALVPIVADPAGHTGPWACFDEAPEGAERKL